MRQNRGVKCLPLEQLETLERWLFDYSPAPSYTEIRGRLKAEFNAETSEAALSRYFQERSRTRMLAHVVKAGRAGNAAWGDIGQRPIQTYQALMEMVARTAFEIPVNGAELSLKDLKDLAGVAALGVRTQTTTDRMRLTEREVRVKEMLARIWNRELVMKEEKHADWKEKEAEPESKGGISDETLEEIIRRAKIM